MKVTEVGACLQAHYLPIDLRMDLSVSTPAGTRKIANYACAGQSQAKAWWKFEVVLTCKSFIRHGYSGERLIELFSSWFRPKYPSGQQEPSVPV